MPTPNAITLNGIRYTRIPARYSSCPQCAMFQDTAPYCRLIPTPYKSHCLPTNADPHYYIWSQTAHEPDDTPI